MQDNEKYDLAGQVIGCAMRVHGTLGSGFLESVYQNALCLELSELGPSFDTEKKPTVFYREKPVGTFSADIIVGDALIIELKATQALLPIHEVQLVNYLTATGIDEGLLLNFGTSSLQFKKKFRSPKPTQDPPDLLT